MALSSVSLTLKQKIVNSKNVFFNNDEKTDMLLIYGECGKNSVAAADVADADGRHFEHLLH
jgi:hypothetical protein